MDVEFLIFLRLCLAMPLAQNQKTDGIVDSEALRGNLQLQAMQRHYSSEC